MDFRNVCIVGGSGFVGRALADHLTARGVSVRVITRSLPRAMPLAVLPTVELAACNPHDVGALKECFDNMDAVVNLVGILHEGRRQSFEGVHAELPRKVVEACRATGVQQLLHMSALGAAQEAPSRYLRSKAAGEQVVREAGATLPFTIFRPSIIFGAGDRFLNLFARLVRTFPVVPLAGARSRLQPIWVEDVARAMAGALGNARCFGQAYELAGPRVYTLEELVRYVAATVGREPRIWALGSGLATLQAAVFERLPGKLITRDNLRSLQVDNVATQPFPEVFGFRPAALEAVVPEYLAPAATRARYARYRHFAGR